MLFFLNLTSQVWFLKVSVWDKPQRALDTPHNIHNELQTSLSEIQIKSSVMYRVDANTQLTCKLTEQYPSDMGGRWDQRLCHMMNRAERRDAGAGMSFIEKTSTLSNSWITENKTQEYKNWIHKQVCRQANKQGLFRGTWRVFFTHIYIVYNEAAQLSLTRLSTCLFPGVWRALRVQTPISPFNITTFLNTTSVLRPTWQGATNQPSTQILSGAFRKCEEKLTAYN